MSYARGSGAGFKRLAGLSKAALRPFVGSISVSKGANELAAACASSEIFPSFTATVFQFGAPFQGNSRSYMP